VSEWAVLPPNCMRQVTAVLKSKSFSVEAHAESGSDTKIKADAIKDIVGSNVSIQTAFDNTNRVTFKGTVHLPGVYCETSGTKN
jgi:hypothetical protein